MRPTEADVALLAHTPVEAVPRFGEFVAMERNGHRFLAAKDGLWLEARRAWGSVLLPIAVQHAVPMPFGSVEQRIELRCGQIPLWCFAQFSEDARACHPVECGAVVIWNEFTGSFRYHLCESLEAVVGHLSARWPRLGDGEHVVLDIHSHGPIPAFLSEEDRSDMGAGMVIACVLGRVHQDTPEVALSVFACGLDVPMDVPEWLLAACRRGNKTFSSDGAMRK